MEQDLKKGQGCANIGRPGGQVGLGKDVASSFRDEPRA